MAKLVKGLNDLQTTNPELVSEWDYEKNGDLKPSDVLHGTNKKVWWKCSKGHKWLSSPHNRRNGNGCPYCSGRLPIIGETDLESKYPNIAKEWNYNKNGSITPKDVTYGSSKKYWWCCSKGHEWQASVGHRTAGEQCPICMSELKTSFPEQAIVYYSKLFFPNTINRYKPKWLKGVKKGQSEIDVFIPDLNVGIEYDGELFHSNIDRDIIKDRILNEHSILLFRIREPKCPVLNSSSVCIVIKETKSKFYYESAIMTLFQEIKTKYNLTIEVDIDICRDYTDILKAYEHTARTESFADRHPELVSEWDYSKNGKVTPEVISYGSNKLIWWKCTICNNEWQDTPKHRAVGRGCPKCAINNRITTRTNKRINNGDSFLNWCLQNGEWGQKLLKEWSDKNSIQPDCITYGSSKKVLWKCEIGHEWSAVIANRMRGASCPFCTNKQTLKGYNDLETIRPDLMKEWMYDKNKIHPSQIRSGSNQKVWWRCVVCSGEWEAVVYNRTKQNGSGCPYCAGQKVKIGYNDLATTNPELSDEWDYQKNILSMNDVTSGTKKKAWWICHVCDFEWQASICDRANGHGCPRCARRKAARSKREK